MNYDDWKLESPDEPADFECNFCGNLIENEGYCSRECYLADNDENC